MKAKAWQIAVIVGGFCLGGGFAAYSLMNSDEPELVFVAHYVDVETGDVYRLDTRKLQIGMPGLDPTTGKQKLMRLTKKPSGGWMVGDHDLAMMRMIDKSVKNVMVDEQTGELTATPKSPVDYPAASAVRPSGH